MHKTDQVFKKLLLHKWRQFDNVEVDFHPRLTVLTGANGSGKTTILNILNKHFGWNIDFVSNFEREKDLGITKYVADLWVSMFYEKLNQNNRTIGEIFYENGKEAILTVPNEVSSTYSLEFQGKQEVKGFHVPSHRPIYRYQKVDQIPTNLLKKKEVFRLYSTTSLNRYVNFTRISENFYIKETLMSLATFGYGNDVMPKNIEAVEIFEGFQEILRKILPPKLGFKRIIVRIPEVILDTDSGEFSLDAVSGGVSALIDLAWQIYMYEEKGEKYVVLIDEPENHLHPEMQKRILPNFIEAFPSVQFIVATHNPFIVSSVEDSNVYILDYNNENRVFSKLLNNINKAGSSNEILRQVLGLTTASPIWVEDELTKIINEFSKRDFDENVLNEFRMKLSNVGLDEIIPESIANLMNTRDDKA